MARSKLFLASAGIAALVASATSAKTFITDFREAQGIPALGLIGPDAVREAFEGDLRQLQDLLQGAIKKALELSGEEDWWPYIHGLFDDFIVVENKDGKLLRYPYEVDGTKVSLGNPQEVIKTFEPVTDGGMREAVGPFIEADSKATQYRIRVIRQGVSGNRNFYPADVLREAVPLFDGVRVFVKSDEEHLKGQGKDVRNLIGVLRNPAFVEAEGEIHADLLLIEPEGDIAVKIREAWKQQLTDLFGFSIDARAKARVINKDGQRVREAVSFLKVSSVDLIVEPGAGGGIINLLEAQGTAVMGRDEIIALLEAKGLLKDKDTEQLSDDQLIAMLTEAVNPETDEGADDLREAEDENSPVTRAELRMVEARASARVLIDASQLPDKAKLRLKAKFDAMDSFTDANVREAISDEADYIATFTESGSVRGLGTVGSRIQIGEDRFEKTSQMFEAFFDPDHKDHRHARSFKECYVQVTGDKYVTGSIRNCDQSLMREALASGTFGDVLGDSITRRMIADYNVPTRYDVWRQLANIVNVADFRSQERTRFGGYGDLPAVAQGADYAALASPTDEKATYAVAKKGGTESITLEMIKNDDVGVIRQIPIKMSRSAKRTLGKFVLDFIKDNPVIYDGVTLFHATHGNLGAAALDKASFAAGRLAMLEQTEKDSGEKMGIPPTFLWVPDTLEETAVDLFRRNTENDKNFIQAQNVQVVPVWYWTDANDWALSADKNDIPSIEIGFLDGNEEPELFVQDNPTNGSMFASDKLTYKIRHIYGGTPVDFRGLYKGVVA
ncbi:phage major capsid protein [Thalassospira sp. SM2505]|nr:hypothetical protein [Rhodospirillales bacterium]